MSEHMNISMTIPVQSWMSAPETLSVLAALRGEGGHPNSLFVGGCVRNALLGEEVADIDLATKLLPEQVMQALEDAGIKAIPTGLDHGTITAVISGKTFEITTLRKDVETDGRHATIAFSDNWREDAERRDFTMNTLLCDEKGNIYDPLGCGVADALARNVVFVGEASERIQEDYLRILRFFRFNALYGSGSMDTLALKACKTHADKIITLSRERISQEFYKILVSDKAANTLRQMFENGILKEFDTGEKNLTFFQHFCSFQQRYGLVALASRLYILAGLSKDHLDIFQERLLIPKVFIKDIQAIEKALDMADMDNDKAVRAVIYKAGRVAAAQSLMIELVQDRVMNGYAQKALSIIQKWDIPNCPVDGSDLIRAGIAPGPELGETLNKLEHHWIKSDFKLERSELLELLQKKSIPV
jgi:poly(A) polymerase